MEVGRIRTEWGALNLTPNRAAVVCVQHEGGPCCIYFDSLEQLRQACDSRKISVKKWAVAVPRSLCILKPLTLPAVDLTEAVKMIEFELPSLVPLPLDEIVYGCVLLNKKNNMLNVLVCILKLSALDQYLGAYKAVGIEPHRLTLDSLAIQNCFSTLEDLESGSAINAVVDRNHCVVLTCVDGCPRKAEDFAVSDADAGAVSSEVVREILRQRDELPSSARAESRILLGGRQERLEEIRSLFGSASSDSDICDHISIVAHPKVVRYGEAEGKSDSNCFVCEAFVTAGLLDLARNAKFPFSNLLPQKRLKKLQHRVLLFNYIFTVAASAMLLLSLWLCLWALNVRIESNSRKIELEIAPIESIASSVDKKRQRVRAIQNQLAGRGLITQIFHDLYKYTPPNISISTLSFRPRQGKMVVALKGQADSLANALEYSDVMREAVLLSEMQPPNAQVAVRTGGSVAEFKTRCVIRRN